MNVHSFIYLSLIMRARDEQKEAAICEKAIEMIVNEGFDGLSMNKLAKAAGVSPATIYIYFKNREDLLNSLYNTVHQTFTEIALKDFSPDASLEEGLWLQWKNRMKFIMDYPVYFRFFEQFSHSPLIHHKDINSDEFEDSMKSFVMNVIRKGELAIMEPEIFWALAYGPFYSLIRFHLRGKSLMSDHYEITDEKMKYALQLVIKALRPDRY